MPCIVHEDAHLLVVVKPAGWNTHAPSPYAGEGLYEWLRHREPRWADLAIIHRLDKETSGLIVFGKTPLANRSLTEQFTQRAVSKRYRLWTDRPVAFEEKRVRSRIQRVGERYASSSHGGEEAETLFRVVSRENGRTQVDAFPHSGRTHQIRVHAAESGFPILGDALYDGAPFSRVCLHAAELSFQHPETGRQSTWNSEAPFYTDARAVLRAAVIDPAETNAWRVIHGAADGWPEWFVDKLGDHLLSQHEREPSAAMLAELRRLADGFGSRGVYHKRWNAKVRETDAASSSPQLLFGEAAPERFEVRENGAKYLLGFGEGYSIGLFLDQRDNRRRWLTGHVAAGFSLSHPSAFRVQRSEFDVLSDETPNAERRTLNAEGTRSEVLNTFAYTCGFSVAAALGGARVTSLDLSKKYLDWGRANFAANGLDPAAHDFIYGDCFDWLHRLAKKGRRFHAVILDPPTFSQSKQSGAFRVQKDFGKLVADALAVLEPNGVLLASCNAANWSPEEFLDALHEAVSDSRRRVVKQHYAPQPPDFPVSREQPAYLKTCWVQVS